MKRLLLLTALLLAIHVGNAQHQRCATMHLLEKRMQENPELKARIQSSELMLENLINTEQAKASNMAIITIPVVVHVVWNQASQNISDAQILSQIKILNEDFRLLNADSLAVNHPYWPFTADTEIEFCLATKDPQGASTTGITRTQSNISVWNDNNFDNLKNSNLGGKNNWDPTKYLNIYVANLETGLLGFASFPDELISNPELDGVVIRPEAFGSVGTAGNGGYSENDLGRTATHEVGHWLFLRHIWGDEPCGNDFVNDTPLAEEDNVLCPSFPHNANNACGTGANGEMFMNYMDYVDDACMNMFTSGQKNRMRSAIAQLRPGLLSATACGTVGVDNNILEQGYSVYPNPSASFFYIDFGSFSARKVCVYNILSEKIIEMDVNHESRIELNKNKELPKGIYMIDVDFGNNVSLKKKIIIE